MFNTEAVLLYCEKYGIYELYKEKGNVITYYSYFGNEGMYKVTKNVKTGRLLTTKTLLCCLCSILLATLRPSLMLSLW